MTRSARISLLVVLFCLSHATVALTPPLPALTKGDAKKLQVTHSMIGFRNTLVFYTFADAGVVLRLSVDNAIEAFPVTGTVYLFDPAVGADGLAKWLNNQHSDGLYPEVPEPKQVVKLPKDAGSVVEKTFVKEHLNHFNKAKFREYAVKLSLKDQELPNGRRIKGFTEDATVYLKPKK